MLVRSFFLWAGNTFTFEYPRTLCVVKTALLRLAGIKITRQVFIDRGFRCIHPTNITIQDYVSMGHDNHIWAFGPVTIGRYTQTAKDLLIVSGTHDTSSFRGYGLPVVVEAGCWIGARVTILGGVTIGKGCVIGAGSLVNKNIPPWSIAAGVPAKVIRERKPAKEIVSPWGSYSPNDI